MNGELLTGTARFVFVNIINNYTGKNGRVRMWRGGLRSSLSVAAPFVWRCLNSRTITPFPHPPHRTGHADFPHPALGQGSMPLHTEGHAQLPDPHTGLCFPGVHQSSVQHITANVTTWARIGFPNRNPGSSFASACGAFRSACTHYRSFLGLPQSPVRCHFQYPS
jgi:hypothetical protein